MKLLDIFLKSTTIITMILGKSSHPVIMNRIKIVTWSLRDEVESAISDAEAKKSNPDYPQKMQQIKDYYKKSPRVFSEENMNATEPDDSTPEGGEVDDEMAAMASALEENEGDAAEAETAEGVPAQSIAINTEPVKNAIPPFKGFTPSKELLSPGFLFLSDINMEEAVLSTLHSYQLGQSIMIDFIIPYRFKLNGIVIGCKQLSSGTKIISETKPKYRVLMKFTFIQDGERTNLRNFLKSIEPSIPQPIKKMAKSAKDGNEDGDDEDLSDFGF